VLPGCFGGHPPAPPSSYALKRHGSHRLLFTPELTTTYMTGGARHQPSRGTGTKCKLQRADRDAGRSLRLIEINFTEQARSGDTSQKYPLLEAVNGQ